MSDELPSKGAMTRLADEGRSYAKLRRERESAHEARMAEIQAFLDEKPPLPKHKVCFDKPVRF